MSKIASKPIQIPESIKFVINENLINIEGPMGKLSFEKHSNITVDVKDGFAKVQTEDAVELRRHPGRATSAMAG